MFGWNYCYSFVFSCIYFTCINLSIRPLNISVTGIIDVILVFLFNAQNLYSNNVPKEAQWSSCKCDINTESIFEIISRFSFVSFFSKSENTLYPQSNKTANWNKSSYTKTDEFPNSDENGPPTPIASIIIVPPSQ